MGRGCWIAAVIAAAIACPLAVAGAAVAATPARFDAGALRVDIQASPFALSFVDTSDGDVLQTLAGADPASADDPRARYGSLGYAFDRRQPVVNNAYLGYYEAAQANTLWFHATKLASAGSTPDGMRIVADTNDPAGNQLQVDLSRVADGSVAVQTKVVGPLAAYVTTSGAAFKAAPGERYLGFGSRSNAVDQTGNQVFSWAEEGPFSSGDYEKYTDLIPNFTFPTGPTATNFPVPWLVSTRGFGVLIDRPERSYFNLLNDRADAWDAELDGGRLRLVVFAGPHPADVLRRYSDFSGREPVPPAWLFGPWFQPTDEKHPLDLAKRFRAEDVPVTLAQTYTHYLPCGAQVGHEKAEQQQVAAYHALGYRITTYFNPHVCTGYHPVYDEMAAKGYFVKNQLGRPYLLSNPFTRDLSISEVDFTNPAAKAYYQKLLAEAVGFGYDGWMEDFGEYTPTDSVFANGQTGLTMHNRYPVLYHEASTEATGKQAPAVFIRSGFQGVQRYARAVWGGDPTEDWSCADGLCAALHQLLAIGLTGIAYQGSDIGGFHAIVNGRTDDELNTRWLELGAVSGVMRTQANGFSFRDDNAQRSQVWDAAVMPRWRRWTKFRTQMWPYIQAASDQYQRTGMPIARQLSLVYPDDPKAAALQDEFMFGPDLLAAPVIEPDARTRKLYLPRGDWVELWRGVRYDRRTGGLRMVRAGFVRGGRELTVRAPIYELPMFVRAGAVIPLLPPDVDTLAGLPRSAAGRRDASAAAGRDASTASRRDASAAAQQDPAGERGIVDLRDRAHQRVLLAFPRVTRRRSGVQVAAIQIGDRHRRAYRLQASIRFWPCRVTLGGRPLAFRWFRNRRVLHAQFRARNGKVVVSSCRSKGSSQPVIR